MISAWRWRSSYGRMRPRSSGLSARGDDEVTETDSEARLGSTTDESGRGLDAALLQVSLPAAAL